jgi:hypothetical protein
MEWEKINEQAISEITDSFSPQEKKSLEEGSPPSTKSFINIGRRVIDLAEKTIF